MKMREDDYQNHHFSARRQKRKRKKTDRLLNISIGIVIFLILFIGGNLLLGGNFFSKPVKTDITEAQTDEIESNDTTVETDGTDTSDVQADHSSDVQADHSDEEDLTEESDQSSVGGEEQAEIDTTVLDGQWKPIGTVQEEPFVAVYEKEHINWEEMTNALQYATGLGDEMIIWMLRNGGDHQSAVGTVSDHLNKSTPFEVRIEWVTNEGWMPVEVEILKENPYLPKEQTSEEIDSTEE